MDNVWRLLRLAFLLGVLFSCRGHENNNSIIELKQPIHLKGEQLSGAEVPLAPSSLVKLGEYLYLVDKHSDKMISRISVLHPEEQTRIVSVGRAPGEYMRIGGISVCDNGERIVLNDDMNRKLVSYPGTSQLLSANDIIGELNYGGNENIYSVVPFRTGYIASGCFGNNIFSWMNGEGSNGVLFGEYPGNTSIVGTHEFMMRNQLLMAVDQKDTYFVAAGVFCDWIAFYQYKNGAVLLNKEYFSYDSELDVLSFETGSNMSYAIQENSGTMRAYRYLYPAEKDFFALYWGIKSDDLNENNNGCYIIQFGYDGRLKSIFQVDEMLRSFAVDELSRTIYGVTFSSEVQEVIKTYKY